MTYPRNSCRQPDHDRSADYGTVSVRRYRSDKREPAAYRQYHHRAVLRRTVNQPLTQLLVSQAVEVIRQCGSQLLLTNRALFKYQFLHCRQAVAEVSNADLQARNPVIFRAALLDTFRSLNSVIYQRRAENIVYVLFQHGVDDIFDFD